MKRDCRYIKFAHVAVLGIGDAGINSLIRVSEENVYGVDLFAVNTDIRKSNWPYPTQFIQLDPSVTRGFGTGGRPELGRRAAEQSAEQLYETLRDYDMIFLIAGFGGGTGTGVTPILAQIAHELGILTVGIIFMPFSIEGEQTTRRSQNAIEELRRYIDTLIVISNDHLARLTGGRGTLESIFHQGDQVVARSIHIIDDLLSRTGIINVDFADIRAVMQKQGGTMMTFGRARGSNRATQAAAQASYCPILNMTLHGAKNVLLNISGGSDLDLFEIEEIVETIQDLVVSGGHFIFSTVYDELLEDTVEVMVIASGFPTYTNLNEDAPKNTPVRMSERPTLPSRKPDDHSSPKTSSSRPFLFNH